VRLLRPSGLDVNYTRGFDGEDLDFLGDLAGIAGLEGEAQGLGRRVDAPARPVGPAEAGADGVQRGSCSGVQGRRLGECAHHGGHRLRVGPGLVDRGRRGRRTFTTSKQPDGTSSVVGRVLDLAPPSASREPT
jgi:hypothetical protein